MCTCPNYMMFAGQIHSGEKEKYTFVGHHEFSKMKKVDVPFIEVPCGKCLECRIQHSRSWADRCVIEAERHPNSNYFITLTYDDLHLPEDESVHKEHWQLFIKRLRKKLDIKDIKYFMCGEYGSEDLRPHMHAILFNCPLDDLSYEFEMEDPFTKKLIYHYRIGDGELYFSKTIYDTWIEVFKDGHKEHYGMISVAPFSYNCAAYVARYVVKKVDGVLSYKYDELGIEPEFCLMSKGLGDNGYSDDVVVTDQLLVARPGSCVKSHSPRYFDKLYRKKYGDDVYLENITQRNVFRRKQRSLDEAHKISDKDQQNIARDIILKKRLDLVRDL